MHNYQKCVNVKNQSADILLIKLSTNSQAVVWI